jgi:integrase
MQSGSRGSLLHITLAAYQLISHGSSVCSPHSRRERNYLFIDDRTGKSLTDTKRGFTKACRLAGVEDFTFHDLRHTFSTRL